MSPTTATNNLTANQIEEYRENGFLVIDSVFNPLEVDALRQAVASPEVTKLLEERGHANQAVHLHELTTFHPLFMELAKDRRIVDRIIPLLGPDIQLQHSKLATKPPTKGVGSFAWHQDLAFYPHSNDSLLSVMVMLDDATPHEHGSRQPQTRHPGPFQGRAFCGRLHPKSSLGRCLPLCANHTVRGGNQYPSLPHPARIARQSLRSSPPGHRLFLPGGRRLSIERLHLSDCICKDTGILINCKRREMVRCDIGTMRLPKRLPDNPFYSGSAFGNAWNQAGALVDEKEFFQV